MTIDELSNILLKSPNDFSSALERYLAEGGDINARDEEGAPLIVHATIKANFPALSLLLKNSANINQRCTTRQGISALHCVVDNTEHSIETQLQLLDFLLQNNADANIKNHRGDTPLHHLVWNYQPQEALAKKLIEYKADINLKNRYGNTAILDAAEKHSDAIVRLLIQEGADIEALLKYPGQAMTIHPKVSENLRKYRPKFFEILKENEYIISTPSSPYKPNIAQAVSEHNEAILKARIIETKKALHHTLNADVNSIIYSYIGSSTISDNPMSTNSAAPNLHSKMIPTSPINPETIQTTPEAIQIAPINLEGTKVVLEKLNNYIENLPTPHLGTFYGKSAQDKKLNIAKDIQRMMSRELKAEDFLSNLQHIHLQIKKNRSFTGPVVLHGYGKLDELLKEAKKLILESVKQQPYSHTIAELAEYIENAKDNKVERRSTLFGLRSSQPKKLKIARDILELIKPGSNIDKNALKNALEEAIKINSKATVKTPFRGPGRLNQIYENLLKEINGSSPHASHDL